MSPGSSYVSRETMVELQMDEDFVIESPKRGSLYERLRVSRVIFVQVIYQHLVTQEAFDVILHQFQDMRVKSEYPFKAHQTLLTKLVKEAEDTFDTTTDLILKNLDPQNKWSKQNLVVKSILYACCFELRLLEEQTPVPVVIQEYLGICFGFLDDQHVAFCNKVLDKISKSLGCSLSSKDHV